MKKWILTALFALCASAFAENRIMMLKHLQNASSYFSINIQDSGLLNGTYPGWCVDWNRPIEDDRPYNIKFYSSYNENLPPGFVAKPENLDKVNWLINQNFVGKNAGNSLGIYTSGDVQLAIWTLIDDNFNSSTVGPYSEARVQKIVSLSMQYGTGFYPTCRQEVVILIDSGTPQGTMIEIRRDHFRKCDVPEEGIQL
jgi:hypothetical protein